MSEKKKPHTSAEVKNRYNEKAYDRIGLMVYKGEKDKVKQRAESLGLSVSGYINMLIGNDIEDFTAMK